MKRILLAAVFLLIPVMAQAEVKLPPMSAGAYYSFKDHAVNQMETFTAISFPSEGKYANLINLELGAAGDAEESRWKGIVALSVTIPQLQLKSYINMPVLDCIGLRPAIIFGLGPINGQDLSGAKFDPGIGFSVIQWKG